MVFVAVCLQVLNEVYAWPRASRMAGDDKSLSLRAMHFKLLKDKEKTALRRSFFFFSGAYSPVWPASARSSRVHSSGVLPISIST